MIKVNIQNLKIPLIHIIGSSLLLLTAIGISITIDYHYQWQNRAALSIATRIDQEIEEYLNESNQELRQIHHKVMNKPKYYPRYAAFKDIREAMYELNAIYAKSANELIPLSRASINQQLGTSLLNLQKLAKEEQTAYKRAYQMWQDLITIERKAGFSKDLLSIDQMEKRRAFRQLYKNFSFPELADCSKAKAYWLLKRQELLIFEQLEILENLLLKDVKRANDYHYSIQSKAPQLTVALGKSIKIEVELLRGQALSKKEVKVLDPDYKLVEKDGTAYLQKKTATTGIQKDSVLLEIKNSLTGHKKQVSIPLEYYVSEEV